MTSAFLHTDKKTRFNEFIPTTSEKEVRIALKRLNNKKVVDVMGLPSEHFEQEGYDLVDLWHSYSIPQLLALQ